MTTRSDSIAQLRSRGIAFEQRRNGVHLVIRHGGRVYDLWPKTQRWRERDRSAKPGEFAVKRKSVRDGRGVYSLLKVLGA